MGEKRGTGLGKSSKSYRYYRNAVDRHWDPYDTDLSQDIEAVSEMLEGDDEQFEYFRRAVAQFGAGEKAVTEDLSPLAVVSDSVEDQMFLTTQMYEEAKHADFFDRYWTEVINRAEEENGLEISDPSSDRWFNADYNELFERNQEAMHRLLNEDSDENRARAYSHYHLTIEGIFAQTGYYGLHRNYGNQNGITPELPGLVEGISLIRSDEGRHVGFGMMKLKNLVESGVEPRVLSETVSELVSLIHGSLEEYRRDDIEVGNEQLIEYATEKHNQRMSQITDSAEEIPDVEELVDIST